MLKPRVQLDRIKKALDSTPPAITATPCRHVARRVSDQDYGREFNPDANDTAIDDALDRFPATGASGDDTVTVRRATVFDTANRGRWVGGLLGQ